MPAQVVERALGGGDRLDAEALEQRAGPELRPGEAVGDVVVDGVGGRRPTGASSRPKTFSKVWSSHIRLTACRGAGDSSRRSAARSCARRSRSAPPSTRGHAEIGQRHALRAEHAEDVVVGGDEQLGGVGKGRVLGEPARVGVAVRAEDRQAGDLGVERAGDAARRGVGGKQAVGIKQRHCAPSPVRRRSAVAGFAPCCELVC